MKDFQIDILSYIFSVFFHRHQFEHNLGDQVFRVFNNNPKSTGVPTQYPVYQFFVGRRMSNSMVHVLDQTGEEEKCCIKSRLFLQRRALGFKSKRADRHHYPNFRGPYCR